MRPALHPAAVGLCLAAFLGGPLAAQERLKDDDVVLKTVRPDHADFRELYGILNDLHGRELWFEDGRKTHNILLGTDSLLIYEQQANLDKILATIAMLDVPAEQSPSELELILYNPKNVDVHVLYGLAQQLFGRQFQVGSGGSKANISMADQSIVINDFAPAAGEILAKLKLVDESFAPPADDSAAPSYETFEYRPRSLDLRMLESALGPFRRMIDAGPGSGRAQRSSVQNISVAYDLGLLTMRDLPENIAAVREMLERIDRPPVQVMLTCFVLSARSDDAGDAPEDLSRPLHQLLPYESYQIDATGLVRISTRQGKRVSIGMTARSEGHDPRQRTIYQLNAVVGAFDPDGKSLGLDNCTVTSSGPTGGGTMFDTSTTIFEGEYAVLGVAGGDPLFIVLRMTPVGVKKPS